MANLLAGSSCLLRCFSNWQVLYAGDMASQVGWWHRWSGVFFQLSGVSSKRDECYAQ